MLLEHPEVLRDQPRPVHGGPVSSNHSEVSMIAVTGQSVIRLTRVASSRAVAGVQVAPMTVTDFRPVYDAKRYRGGRQVAYQSLNRANFVPQTSVQAIGSMVSCVSALIFASMANAGRPLIPIKGFSVEA
jgi:hypothetical protein